MTRSLNSRTGTKKEGYSEGEGGTVRSTRRNSPCQGTVRSSKKKQLIIECTGDRPGRKMFTNDDPLMAQ